MMTDERFVRLARARIDFALSPFPRIFRRWGTTEKGGTVAPFPVLSLRGSPEGFDLYVAVTPGGVLVASPTGPQQPEGWHSHAWKRDAWESEELLLDDLAAFLVLALSPFARMKVFLRGGRAYRWRMEFRDEKGWKGMEEVRVGAHPGWGRKEKRILQNDLILLPPFPGPAANGEKDRPSSPSRLLAWLRGIRGSC